MIDNASDGFLEVKGNKIIYGSFMKHETTYVQIYSCDLEDLFCEMTTFHKFNKTSLDVVVETCVIDDSIILLTASSKIIAFSIFSKNFSTSHLETLEIPLTSGHTSYKNTIFTFGGLSNKLINNALIGITTNSSYNSSTQILSSNQISPSLRSKSALLSVRNKLYIFAGQDQNIFLNDLWSYTPSLAKWSQILYKNKGPSPRHSFSHASIGDIIIIWGGITKSGYSNEMFIYNVVTNKWTEIDSTSHLKPSKRYGACMVLDFPLIYIGGGANEFGICPDVWVYDLGKEQYLKTNLLVDRVYANCFMDRGGIQYRSGEDPTLLGGKIFEKSLIGQMESGMIVQTFSKGLFIAGGEKNYGVLNEAFKYTYNNLSVVGVVSDIPCNSMFAYHGSSIYYFSGSYYNKKNKVFHLLPRAKFAKFDLRVMCENYNCNYECSPGFVLNKFKCVQCPPGTYSNNSICLPCSKGYFNPLPGASSILQCYPCPEGYFNDKQGSSLCKACPIGNVCYAGSVSPESLRKKSKILMQKLLSSKLGKHEKKMDRSLLFSGFSISVILFFSCFISERFKKLIVRFDLYQDIHNHEIGEKIYLQKNLIGAFFTLLFYISFACIGSSIVYYYFTQNENKEYSLVPLVLLDHILEDFQADFEISVQIKNYAGHCIENNINTTLESQVFTKCTDNINISIESLKRQKIYNECMLLDDHSCLIKITCSRCKVDKSSLINIRLKGNFSYSSGFLVNFTSNPFITKAHQSSLSEIYPSKDTIFIGPNPSIFSFLLTPSLLELSNNFETSYFAGYQNQVFTLPKEGSKKNVDDLLFPSELHLKIVLKKDAYGLMSKISIKENFFSLVGRLFGNFTGLLTIFGLVMMTSEKISKKILSKKNIIQLKQVAEKRTHFISIFREFSVDFSKEENMFALYPVPSTENERVIE